MRKRVVEEQIWAERKAIKELELLVDCGHPKLWEIKRLITESQDRLAGLLQEEQELAEAEKKDIPNNEMFD